MVFYEARADLLVCEKFDPGVGEYAEERGGVAFEQPSGAVGEIYVLYGNRKPTPFACVLGEVRVGSLEEDLDTV